MTDPILILTHLAAFALGGGTVWFLVRWKGRDVIDAAAHDVTHNPEPEATPVPHTKPLRRPTWRLTVGLVGLIVGLVGVGFGIQQAHFQADQQAAQDAQQRNQVCVADWGTDFTETLDQRLVVNAALSAAETRRDDAVDAIIGVVVGLRASPPTASDADVAAVLTEFTEAKANLTTVRANAKQEKAERPYPILDCED